MIAQLNRIANQLATIASVDDAKEIRDKAEAIRVYAQWEIGGFHSQMQHFSGGNR